MDKYFDLLLDLLEIQDKKSYQELVHQIAHAPAEKTFLFAHRGSFILKAYLDLMKGELAPEEFVLIGDVESAVPLWEEGQKSAYQILDQLKAQKLPKEDILILDLKARETLLTTGEKEQIQKILEQHQKTLWLT